MGWATGYITRLAAGETVSFRPRGDSMTPRINSGDLCTVAPCDPATLVRGDIVLCKVRGAEYLHLVKAIQGGRFQIGCGSFGTADEPEPWPPCRRRARLGKPGGCMEAGARANRHCSRGAAPFLIGNHGHINGWVGPNAIFGKLTAVGR